MTDAHLMDADCVHGVTWWECETCGRELGELLDAMPAYCPIHEHYKWCEHNGGVMGVTGWEAP